MRLKGGGGRDDRKGGPLLQQEPKTQQLEEIAYARRIIGIVTQNRVPVANSSTPPPPPSVNPLRSLFFWEWNSRFIVNWPNVACRESSCVDLMGFNDVTFT